MLKRAVRIGFGLLFVGGAPAPAQTTCTSPQSTIAHSSLLTANTNPNVLVKLSTTKYPLARCNDGTAAAYAFRLGVGSTRWIFHMQEGGACRDSVTCLARRQQDTALTQTSSKGINQSYANTTMLGKGAQTTSSVNGNNNTGMLSPVAKYNPDFWDANVVKIFYCSSDHFSGGYAPPAGTVFSVSDASTWYFQGRAIAMAAVQEIVARPEFAGATDVIWAGTSAGGIGVYRTIDDIAPLIPSGTRLIGLSDGGFFSSAYPAFDPYAAPPDYLSTASPTLVQSIGASQDITWRGRGDVRCDSTAGAGNHLNCYDPSYILSNRYIPLPVLVAQAEADTQALQTENVQACQITRNCTAGTTAADQQPQADGYIAAFKQNALTPYATALPSPASTLFASKQGHSFVFSPSFNYAFTTTTGRKTKFMTEVANFVRQPCPATQTVEVP